MILVTALAWAGYSVVGKPLFGREPSLAATFHITWIGTESDPAGCMGGAKVEDEWSVAVSVAGSRLYGRVLLGGLLYDRFGFQAAILANLVGVVVALVMIRLAVKEPSLTERYR